MQDEGVIIVGVPGMGNSEPSWHQVSQRKNCATSNANVGIALVIFTVVPRELGIVNITRDCAQGRNDTAIGSTYGATGSCISYFTS